MPSAAKVYSARLSAAARHSREVWDIRIERMGVEEIPEGVTHVELHWRRKGSKKHEMVTEIAEVRPSRPGSSTGMAEWASFMSGRASISRSAGKALPKYYEFLVKGRSALGAPLHTLGKLTVDIAHFCNDAPLAHGGQPALLPMKQSGALRVTISASRVQEASAISRAHSHMSIGSDISELEEAMDVTAVISKQQDPAAGSQDQLKHFADGGVERTVKSAAELLSGFSGVPVSGAENDFEASLRRRSASLNADEVAYYLRALASDDSDSDLSRNIGPWGWIKKAGMLHREQQQQRQQQKRFQQTQKANLGGQRSGNSLPDGALNGAVRAANAGPVPSEIDLGALAQTNDADFLRKKLRQLMDERNELAHRNWALHATNMLLQAELDSNAEQLGHAAARVKKAERYKKEALDQVEQLKVLSAAQAQENYRSKQSGRRQSYQTDELQELLVLHKTQLAEAQFELLELRQELRRCKGKASPDCSAASSAYSSSSSSLQSDISQDSSPSSSNNSSMMVDYDK